MKNKIIIIAVIIAFICGFIAGTKVKDFKIPIKDEKKEEVKTTLTGLYMSDKLEGSIYENNKDDFLNQELRYTITIYNNTLVKQSVRINYIKDEGYIVTRGSSTSFSYSTNNDTKTMILRGLENNTSYTYTYSDDFNTIIDNNNMVYRYCKGTLEDNIEGKNIREVQREEELEGTFKQENGQDSFTFYKNGTLQEKIGYQDTIFYFLNGDNIRIYMGDSFYYEGVLSDNKTKLTITNTHNSFYPNQDYTKAENGSNTFILQK